MLALLVGVVAVPVTSTALFLQQDALVNEVDPTNLRQKAVEDRRRLRGQRRMYWQAIERYQERKKAGEEVEKPDINDTESITKTLVNTEPEEVKEAAPEETTLTARELNTQDRGLLRRYTRAGFCPESLKSFRIPGFYGLCVSLAGSKVKKEPVTGLLNHNAYMYQKMKESAPKISGFKLRMLMVKQANDRATRREGGSLPGRPTTCVMNPDCLNPRYSD